MLTDLPDRAHRDICIHMLRGITGITILAMPALSRAGHRNNKLDSVQVPEIFIHD